MLLLAPVRLAASSNLWRSNVGNNLEVSHPEEYVARRDPRETVTPSRQQYDGREGGREAMIMRCWVACSQFHSHCLIGFDGEVWRLHTAFVKLRQADHATSMTHPRRLAQKLKRNACKDRHDN